MLNTIELKEGYELKNGVLYAVQHSIETKRKVDGCQVRIELEAEYSEMSERKIQLEQEIDEITAKMVENRRLDNSLAAVGYCKIDNPVYRKIDGILVKEENGKPIVESYAHAVSCVTKGEKK